MAYCPRTHDIHCAVRSAKERSDTGGIVQMLHALQVLLCIYRLYFNVLRSLPDLVCTCFLCLAAAKLPCGSCSLYVDVLKIRFHNYGLFDVKLAVEISQCLKYVAAYVYVVFNAYGLEVLDAGGITGNNEYCAVTYSFECGGTVLGVLIIA